MLDTAIEPSPFTIDKTFPSDDDMKVEDDNSKNYFIPSLDDISMSSSCGTTSSTYKSNYYASSYRYCTPRSLSKVQSIESEIDDVPLQFKTNIWSNDYLSTLNKNVTSFTEFTLSTNDNTNISTSPTIDKFMTVSEAAPLTTADTKEAVISPLSTTSNLKPPTLFTPVAAATTNSATATTFATPPNCLTFRTYTGAIFTVPKTSKFFVIKSYNILDVNASFIHNIWTSTELGNKRLDKAYNDLATSGNPNIDGKIFLFFSVNSSGKFCGVAEMKSAIDFTASSDIWCEQTRWKGIFPVEWLLIKDVPNKFFQHLKIPANEFKPVTNSRDTQEIPFEIGISMLKIISSFRSND
ncbi:hypothetical protein G210_3348 [Candida maltosa Xu316]|uniref:YTH domain-containing protein n=1 Tax=Candida maltosa (strain Xu316) TaxID=1245528 RepID=M3IJ40_CANMX|nr:hypothetical protein G210_3348 [Candida maltosa Xu316]